MKQSDFSLTAISPIDGRYRYATEELSEYFSEFAVIKYRIIVEIEYLIAYQIEKSLENYQQKK